MRPPEILNEQEPIIKWAQKKREAHMNLSHIIFMLVSPVVSKFHENDEEYIEAWYAYQKFNSSYQDEVLTAITMNSYRKRNDFSENALVTNGVLVGFAKSMDLSERSFFLCPALNKDYTLGKFFIDEFYKLVPKY